MQTMMLVVCRGLWLVCPVIDNPILIIITSHSAVSAGTNSVAPLLSKVYANDSLLEQLKQYSGTRVGYRIQHIS